MSYKEDRELDEIARTERLRQSFKEGVFISEGGLRNTHIGFGKCIHGNDVYGCEKCRKEKP